MRISDWSSDVCSSDLLGHDRAVEALVAVGLEDARHQPVLAVGARRIADHALFLAQLLLQQQRVLPHEAGLGGGGGGSGGDGGLGNSHGPSGGSVFAEV